MRLTIACLAVVLALACLAPLCAQQSDRVTSGVPRLVRITNTFHPANSLPVGPTESATLSIYKEQQGGTPLWQETQNVTLDAEGHYTAILGITQTEGVPVDLFSSTEPRWLGVQFNRPGEVEQPRIQLVSVPFALKAADAETLGGKPASAYLLDPNAPSASAIEDSAANSGTATAVSLTNPKLSRPRVTTGTTNYIPYFTDNSGSLGNSILYQSGGNIGLGTTSPASRLAVSDASGNAFEFFPGATANTNWLQAYNRATSGFNNLIFNAASHIFAISGLERMRVDGQGRVGIGTPSPVSPFDVSDGTRHLWLSSRSYAVQTGLLPGTDIASWNDVLNLAGDIQRGTPNGGVNIGYFSATAGWTSALGIRNAASGYSNLLLMPSGGNVGIGTTTPLATLDINGPVIAVSGTQSSALLARNTFSGSTFIDPASAPATILAEASTPGTTNGAAGGRGLAAYGGAGGLAIMSSGNSGGMGGIGLHVFGGVGGNGAFNQGGQGGTAIVATGGDAGGGVNRPGFGGRGITVTGGGAGPGTQGGVGIFAIGGNGGGGAGGIAGIFVPGDGGTTAALFTGDVNVSGTLTKGAGSFRIDHPLDPSHKYLSHSFVESPDMKNIYDGIAVLDSAGTAWVELPEWFQALNRDFRYQLTALGAPAPGLFIAVEVENNKFAIAGGNPGARVSWSVTGIRQDAYANAHRIPVEETKPAAEQNTYLHPELYGQPEERSAFNVHPREDSGELGRTRLPLTKGQESAYRPDR